MTTIKERATVYVRFSSREKPPVVGDVIDVQGLGKWKCRVLKVLGMKPNEDGSFTVEMRVERWMVEEDV